MRLPMECEIARRRPRGEARRADRLMVFAAGLGVAGDHPARAQDFRVAAAERLHQAVLARAGRPDDGDEPPAHATARAKEADVDLPVRHAVTRAHVVKDAHDRRRPAFASSIRRQHGFAVGRVEARRRLVQQERGIGMGKAARDVHALLFAARKGRGRQGPERGGYAAGSAALGARPKPLLRDSPRPEAVRPRHRRRHPRHHAQELADIAKRLAAERQDLARLGFGQGRARRSAPTDPGAAR
jgi:hypothetical protein